MRFLARRLAYSLLLLAPLAGCVDSLGLGGNCSSAMTSVRRDEGRPPDQVQGPNDVEGDFSEVWTYWQGSSGNRYIFRWGISLGHCEVEGPFSVSRTIRNEGTATLP